MSPPSHRDSSRVRRASLLAPALCLGLLALPVLAEPPVPQHETGHRHDDPRLEWGPCPDFLPEGCRIAVLNGDPAQPNADLFFKVPGGAQIARHWHTSAERIVLLSGRMEVDYAGRPTLALVPGSYAYGPAKVPHSARCAPGDDCVLFIAFEQAVDATPGDPPPG